MSKVVVESLFRPLRTLLKHLLDKVVGIVASIFMTSVPSKALLIFLIALTTPDTLLRSSHIQTATQ